MVDVATTREINKNSNKLYDNIIILETMNDYLNSIGYKVSYIEIVTYVSETIDIFDFKSLSKCLADLYDSYIAGLTFIYE